MNPALELAKAVGALSAPRVFGLPAFRLWWCGCIIVVLDIGLPHHCPWADVSEPKATAP